MNIKQAKQRFTELSGLPATKDGSITAMSRLDAAYIIKYISYRTPLVIDDRCHDRRKTRYWVLLVQAIESYMEVA